MLEHVRTSLPVQETLSKGELESLLRWAFQKLVRDGVSHADAEELSNDAAYELVVSVDRSKESIRNVKAYFSRIIRGKVSRHFEALQRERALHETQKQDALQRKAFASVGYALEPEPSALLELDEVFESFVKQLSSTQLEVLKGLVYGLTVSQIARTRNVSQATISEHVKKNEGIFEKTITYSLSEQSLHTIRTHGSFSAIEHRLRAVFESIAVALLFCLTTARAWAGRCVASLHSMQRPLRKTLWPVVFVFSMTCTTGDASLPLLPFKKTKATHLPAAKRRPLKTVGSTPSIAQPSSSELPSPSLEVVRAKRTMVRSVASRVASKVRRLARSTAAIQQGKVGDVYSKAAVTSEPALPSNPSVKSAHGGVGFVVIPSRPKAVAKPAQSSNRSVVTMCQAGEQRSCYDGFASTRSKGSCRAGVQTCSAKGVWGTCVGQVVPRTEQCDNKDDNCDGKVDENLFKTCSLGCGEGKRFCVNGRWDACNAPAPRKEICDGEDNDCNGKIDESCKAFCVTRDGKAVVQIQDIIHIMKPGHKIRTIRTYKENLCELGGSPPKVNERTDNSSVLPSDQPLRRTEQIKIARDYSGRFYLIDSLHKRMIRFGPGRFERAILLLEVNKVYTQGTPAEVSLGQVVRLSDFPLIQQGMSHDSYMMPISKIPYLTNSTNPEKHDPSLRSRSQKSGDFAISYETVERF